MAQDLALDWDSLRDARRALIGNPYTTPDDALRAGRTWLLENVKAIPVAMLDLCERNLPGDARKLALAFIHAAAQSGCEAKFLSGIEEAVSLATERGLRLTPPDLRRLGMALGRFERAAARIVGTSSATRRLKETLWTACFGPNLYETLDMEAAIRRQNILILGPPGIGKEVVATVIQESALVADARRAPAHTVNCPGIPAELAESELFGFEKGAHSAADKPRQGRITAANGGTLLLDEVADLPLEIQAKVLAVIENGKVTPLGSNAVQTVSVRYIAATSRPLLDMVQKGTFRDDLFGRLAGTIITIPPLSERREDIVAIGKAIVTDLIPSRKKRAEEGTSSAVAFLDEIHDRWLESEAVKLTWKGNVRELQAVLRERVLGFGRSSHEIGAATSSQVVETADVPERILHARASLREVQDWYIGKVFDDVGKNVSRAADRLGVDRGTVRRRLEKNSDAVDNHDD